MQYIFDSSAHGVMTLGGVYFASDPIWDDEYKISQRTGSIHRMIDGSAVIQSFPKSLTGQPIVLKLTGDPGAITPANKAVLQAYCDAGTPIFFFDGVQNIPVMFDVTKDVPIDLVAFDTNKLLLIGTIYLIRV